MINSLTYETRQLSFEDIQQKTKVRYSGAAYSRCSCSKNLE